MILHLTPEQLEAARSERAGWLSLPETLTFIEDECDGDLFTAELLRAMMRPLDPDVPPSMYF